MIANVDSFMDCNNHYCALAFWLATVSCNRAANTFAYSACYNPARYLADKKNSALTSKLPIQSEVIVFGHYYSITNSYSH